MALDFDVLRTMEYPGRLIIMGKGPRGAVVVLYAITGRSPSSQARVLLIDEAKKQVYVKPTDEETLRTGQPELLVYPAIICPAGGLVVSNGKQTEDIAASFSAGQDAVEILMRGQRQWQYEPDAPNFTPRISGCVSSTAAQSILKRAADGSVIRHYLGVALIPGKGFLLSTYAGANENPLPSFAGEPIEVGIPADDPQACVEALYDALGPAPGGVDYRVSAACAVIDIDGKVAIRVKNRHA